MTREEAMDIIKAEKACVERQGRTGECCRDDLGCGVCDLVQEDVDIIEAIDMAIEALKEDRPQWIPCSEKLPEPHKFVLICGEEGDIEVAQGYISTEIEEFVWLKSSWRFGEVVAWMPLPDPPKGGDS